MIKYAIFDLDGTLLNTLTTITYYVNLILKRKGLKEITEEECKYFVGNGARKLIWRAANSRGLTDEAKIAEIFDEYNEEYNAAPLYLTEPYSGIVELVSALKAKNIKLAVLSNKPDAATVDIVPSFFGDSFEVVHGARDNVALKPMPEGVFEICRELSATVDELMYLGDTNVDMMTGKNAKAKLTVGVSWGFRPVAELVEAGADVVVDNPLEILDLIK